MIEGHIKETNLSIPLHSCFRSSLHFNQIKKVKGLDIYGHNFLYTAYTDNSSFFFKNRKSVIEAFKILKEFSFFSGVKPSKEKCEVAGIGVKKGAKVTLCGMKNIDLKKT